MKMDTDFNIENIKKEIGWDYGEHFTSGMDTNSDEHRRNGSITVDSDDGNDEPQMDIPFKDQTEIKQEVSCECENPSQEVEWVLNKAISEQTNLKLEESQCFTYQNVGQSTDNLKESISDVTDEPVIHVICPQNESDMIFESKNNSDTSRKIIPAGLKRGYSACGQKSSHKSSIFHCRKRGCGKRFNRKESLLQHRRFCHMFRCPGCHKIFRPSFNPSAPKQLVKFECPACHQNFGFLNVTETFPCPEYNCNEIFKDNQCLSKHLKSVHVKPETFHCTENDCSKTFKYKSYLDQHLKLVHVKPETFHCPENDCSFVFKHKSYLEKHMKNIHGGLKTFHCPKNDCSETFKAKSLVWQHLRTFHNDPKYKRTENNKIVKTNDTFNDNLGPSEHLKRVHVDPETFHCQEKDCDKTFKTKKNLSLHLKMVHVKPGTLCCLEDGCNKTFNTRRNLTRHLRNVHVEARYKCTDCNKAFKTRILLKDHMSVHKNETPFKCTVEDCEKMFKAKRSMKLHVKVFHSKTDTFQYSSLPGIML